MMSFEEFEKILKNIGGETVDNKYFNRRIRIKTLCGEIIFEWFENLCNAYIDKIQICGFTKIKIAGTWPNQYKTNIQLYKDNEVIAVIPIEEYEKKDKKL